MNPDTQKFSPAVQRLLDEHIDAVERELAAAGKARTDRRRICDDLEGQIREMLAERVPGNPTEGDLRAVLAELDNPEAYGEKEQDDATGQPARPTASVHAAAGAPGPAATGCSTLKRLILIAVLLVVVGVGLLIFLPILGILGAIALPNFLEAQTRSKVARTRADLHTLATAIERYSTDCLAYPAWTTGEGSAFGPLINRPLLQGQPTFRNRDLTQLKSLTTPVAYLGIGYPTDPFSSAKRATYCYFGDDHTWIVWGTGPDSRYNLHLEEVRTLIDSGTHQFRKEILVQYSYDPTNGTTSTGDIIQYKGGSPASFPARLK